MRQQLLSVTDFFLPFVSLTHCPFVMSSTVKQCSVGYACRTSCHKKHLCVEWRDCKGWFEPVLLKKENAKELVKFLEGIHSERSISNHKQSLASKDLGGMTSRYLSDNPSKSLVPRLTLKDLVDAKSASFYWHERIIARRGLRHRENVLEDNDGSITAWISAQIRASCLNSTPPPQIDFQ